MVMPNASAKAKQTLLNLGTKENIYLMRHRGTALSLDSVYWTHHDKMCIVDQKYAFLGGVDLCYGRYDNWRHSLTDHHDPAQSLWPGDDFYNPCAAESVCKMRYVRNAFRCVLRLLLLF